MALVSIELVPHDPHWEDLYGTVAADIGGALGPTALSVDHVGSTAIPGIRAKPVIDVLVLVETYDPEAPYRDPLMSLGYAFDHRDDAHVFFTGSREGTAVQVHVVEENAEGARDMITFRDFVRSHPDEARRYEALKEGLADRYDDPDAYADAKSPFVLDVIRRAAASADP
jgi:GrpB-like predicted nucleotidyltransferase (UPF0157 family)